MGIKFKRGDQVEICCNEEGFENSYFPATIISEISTNNTDYIVQFNTLLGQDELYPLREFRPASELRPVPPEKEVKRYELLAEVDAYANDGWWKGTVTKTGYDGRTGSHYHVRFERGNGEVEVGKYLISHLRVHHDWVDGVWVCATNRNLS